jgi:hypothetical protein
MLYIIKESVKDTLTGQYKVVNEFESVGTLLATKMVAQRYKKDLTSVLTIQTDYGRALSRRKPGADWEEIFKG